MAGALLACGGAAFEAALQPPGVTDDAGASDDASGGGPDATPATDAKADVRADGPVPCNEPNAVKQGDHCYFVVGPGTQAQVKAACASAGAHLATFASAAELAPFIPAAAATWIGLEASPASNNRADFKWVTGEPVTYDAWYTAEPNANTGCVIINVSNWSDRPCTDSYVGLCERE